MALKRRTSTGSSGNDLDSLWARIVPPIPHSKATLHTPPGWGEGVKNGCSGRSAGVYVLPVPVVPLQMLTLVAALLFGNMPSAYRGRPGYFVPSHAKDFKRYCGVAVALTLILDTALIDTLGHARSHGERQQVIHRASEACNVARIERSGHVLAA